MTPESPIPAEVYLTVQGASGSGKTTTAALLAERTGRRFLPGSEHAETELRDGTIEVNQLESELAIEQWFVDHHLRLLQEQETTDGLVTDFSFESDLAYAHALLPPEDLAQFEDYCAAAYGDLRTPDLFIVLSAPTEVLMGRKWLRYDESRRPDDRVPDPAVLAAVQESHLAFAEERLGDRAVILRVTADMTRDRVAELACAELRQRL